MNLEWKSNVDLSAMHAAWCATRFPPVADRIDPALRQASTELAALAGRLTVKEARFWESALTICVNTQRNDEFANRLIRRAGGSPTVTLTSTVKACVTSVENAFRAAYPNTTQEMELRTGPIQQQWQAYGPGLLNLIKRFTAPTLLVESADIYLVQPMLGGLGYAHLETNAIHVEGVLTNDTPDLPEPVRIAWLLSQLDFERPIYSDLINRHKLRRVAEFAMLAPALVAASELGLSTFDLASVERAITTWRLDVGDASAAALAQVVMTWWETFDQSRPEWHIALTGLDRML